MNISKELLSEVLGCDYEILSIDKHFVKIRHLEAHTSVKWCIHKVAHKCKEWAKLQKITLEDGKQYPFLIASNISDTSEFGASARIMIIDEKFRADTEPEAVFKACQWILDNKDK